jgi:hypothetical protein
VLRRGTATCGASCRSWTYVLPLFDADVHTAIPSAVCRSSLLLVSSRDLCAVIRVCRFTFLVSLRVHIVVCSTMPTLHW